MRLPFLAIALLTTLASGVASAQGYGAPIKAAAITKQLSPIEEGTPATIEIVTITPAGQKLSVVGVTPPASIVYLPSSMQASDCTPGGSTGTDCKQRFQFQVNANVQCTLNGQYRMDFRLANGATSFVTFSLQSENFCSYVEVNACLPAVAPLRINAGQGVKSCNKAYVLSMQSDGNLVLYNRLSAPIWASGTNGKGGAYALFQPDGNFVVYTAANAPIWASGTNGKTGAKLAVQDDGNVVIYFNGAAVWATGTQGR